MEHVVVGVLVNASYWMVLKLVLLLRGLLLTDYAGANHTDCLVRFTIVMSGIMIQFACNRFVARTFNAVLTNGIQSALKIPDDKMVPESELPGERALVKARDYCGHAYAFYLGFANKLLITALPGFWEVWFFSSLTYFMEALDTVCVFRANINRLRIGSEEIVIKKKIGLLVVKCLSIQMSEYLVTIVVVVSSVLLRGDATITGLSNAIIDYKVGCLFLLAQFVPEMVCDIVCLSYLKLHGVLVRQLFCEVHRDVNILVFKGMIALFIVPIAVLISQTQG